MAFRLPITLGDAPASETTSRPDCSEEIVPTQEALDGRGDGKHALAAPLAQRPPANAIVEHQWALQRYIVEWTARHEQLLHCQLPTAFAWDVPVLDERGSPAPAKVPELNDAWTSVSCDELPEHVLAGKAADVSAAPPSLCGRDDGAADGAGMVPPPMCIPSPPRSPAPSLHPSPTCDVERVVDEAVAAYAFEHTFERPEKADHLRNNSDDNFANMALGNLKMTDDLVQLQEALDREHDGDENKSRHKIILMCEFFDQSPHFQRCCTLVILANASCLTFTTENAIRVPGDPGFEMFQNFERVFCLFYIIELCLRLGAQRKQFLFGSEVGWNLFDTLLAVTAAQEQVAAAMAQMGDGESGQNLSYLRVIRLLKMLKLLRVIRVLRAFRELRLVMNSILGSTKALFWSFLLIASICFMFAIGFVQATTELAIQEEGEGSSCAQIWADRNPDDKDAYWADGGSDVELACAYWGSIGLSMLSLFQASTGGYDWQHLAKPLIKAGHLYYAIFCFYIGFFFFIVMNSVTSLFLDSVMSNAQNDEDQIMHDQLARKQEYMAKVVQIFSAIDESGTGKVTHEEFCRHERDPAMVAFASSLDIEASQLEQFFGILSNGGEHAVDLSTFVVGCIKLRGAAKSMDLMEVLITQQRVSEEHSRFVRYCEDQFLSLHQAARGACAKGVCPSGDPSDS